MTDHEDNQRPPVSDEALRLYLLGSLDQETRLRFDELLLVDDEFAERVQLAESVLNDDYVSGRLDENQTELFKEKFLVTQSRKEGVRLSAALSDLANSQPAANVGRPEQTGGFLPFHSPRAWVLAGSLAMLILLVGVVWFISRNQRSSPPLIAQNGPVPSSSPAVASSSPVANSTPSPVPTATPPEATPPATIASFVLSPGALRSGGDMTRIAVPGGERDVVRLSLVVENPTEDPYQAELTTAEGQRVLVRPNLKITRNGHAKVVLSLPARLLHTRDYQVKLTHQRADGQTESAGRYYFRAQEE